MDHPLVNDAYRRDPYGVYRELRSERPVCEVRLPAGGSEFILTRYEDVLTTLRDERFSVDRMRSRAFRQSLSELPEDLQPDQQMPSLLTLDPPDHTRLRKLVSRAFTPRRVEKLASGIDRRSKELLLGLDLEGARGCDLLAGYAAPLPARVIADMLGVPEADHPAFRGWSDRLLRTLVGSASDLAGFRKARDELSSYLESVIAARRYQPQDDLISDLVAAREEDDLLSRDELLGTCILMLVAGHETTANLIANSVWLLLSRPGRLAAFEQDPATAVDEMLRYESPLQAIARVTTEDLELGGVRLPKGSLVSAMLGAANRDPEAFEDPETLDLTRSDNRHLAFGNGIHFCLGSALARLEARLALVELFRQYPDLALVDEQPAWRRSVLLRGLEHLRVRSGSSRCSG